MRAQSLTTCCLQETTSLNVKKDTALKPKTRRGANVIVAVSFAQTSAVESVAAELPDVKFTLIDGVVDAPNVQSIIFKEHEGSFLLVAAGELAD